MQNQQQNMTGQTARPQPDVQDPQQTESSNLQQTLDLQSIDSAQSTISVPGSDGQTQTSTAAPSSPANTDSGGLFAADVSTFFLVVTFVAATVVIGALVKIAKPKHELYPEPVADAAPESTEPDVAPGKPVKKPRSNKKLSRRQRRKQRAS